MNVVQTQRVCGGCTACCKTHEVTEIQKPIGQWCPDCAIGKKCRVYANRPDSCKDFVCQWLKGYSEEHQRPDKSKIVVDYTEILGNPVCSIWEVTEGAITRSFAQETTQFALQAGIPVVHVLLSGKKIVLLPDGTKRSLHPEEIITTT